MKPKKDRFVVIASVSVVFATPAFAQSGTWITTTIQWTYNERYRQASLIWMDPSAQRPEITSIRDVRPLVKPEE